MPVVMNTSCTSASDAGDRELPFEAEPDVERECRSIATTTAMMPVALQLRRHGRTDHLDAADFDGLTERALHLVARGRLRLLVGLLCDADQRFLAGGANALNLDFAETQRLSLSRTSATSSAPLLAWISISEPPLKSTP